MSETGVESDVMCIRFLKTYTYTSTFSRKYYEGKTTLSYFVNRHDKSGQVLRNEMIKCPECLFICILCNIIA